MSHKKALIVGVPFYTKKYRYHIDALESAGFKVKFLVNADCDTALNETIEYAGSGVINRFKRFLALMLKYKPQIIDIYDYSLLTLFYILTSKLLGVRSRLWIIGYELEVDNINANSASKFLLFRLWLKSKMTWWSASLVDQLIIKEVHQERAIKIKNEALLEKAKMLHNCVPVNEVYEKRQTTLDFIYANAVTPARNVKDIVVALSSIYSASNAGSSTILGFSCLEGKESVSRATDYSKNVYEQYKSYNNLDEHVSVEGFVEDILPYIKRSKYFLFPADIVFANYALLESMAIGVVPIVYKGEGFERIVEHGVNGIVAEKGQLTASLNYALKLSEEDYEKLSRAAHKTILYRFSILKWYDEVGQANC